MIKEQEEREQQERAQEEAQREQRRVEELKSNRDNNGDMQANKSQDDNNVSPTKQELQEQGFNVTAYTVIKDKEMLDEIVPGMYYDKNSVVVAKVDGKITALARVAGEERFEEIETKSANKSIGQVTAFQYNKGYEEDAGTEIAFTDKSTYRIRENDFGQLEVGRVHIDSKTGEKTVTNVDSDMAYPTRDEKNRVDSQNAIDKDNKKGVLTQEEIDIELAKLGDELREDYVKKDERVKEGITIEELKEIISDCEKQLREDHHEPSLEPEHKHYKI